MRRKQEICRRVLCGIDVARIRGPQSAKIRPSIITLCDELLDLDKTTATKVRQPESLSTQNKGLLRFSNKDYF